METSKQGYRTKSVRSYSVSQHDPEEDDDTVIVYNDATLEESWEFSQFSASQSQDPTTRSKVEPTANEPHRHNEQKQEAPISVSHNRRGLARRGRNFRRQRNHPIMDNNGIQNENNTHDQVDEFASLRSKIDRLSPKKQENLSEERDFDSDSEASANHEGQSDEENTNNPQSFTRDTTSREKQASALLQTENKDNADEAPAPVLRERTFNKDERLCSPPDFDFCTSDNDDDKDEDEEKEKEKEKSKRSSIPPRLRVRDQNARLGSSSERRESTEKLQNPSTKSKRRSSNLGHLPKQISVPSSSIPTARNHKRKRPETIGRRAFASSQQPPSSQPTKSSTTCENVKSIVGLRPTHWRRGSNKVQKRDSNSTERKPLRQLAKSSALMAATRFSFHKPSQQTKDDTTRRVEKHDIHRSNRTKNSSRSPVERNDEHEISPETKQPPSETAKSPFSFAPSFVQTKLSALSQDSIGDDSGDDSRVVTTPVNHFALTPPLQRRRRSKAATGEWVRRLITLQTALCNDSVRLQNKAFSRHRMLLDASDPRKRAKTFTDVTILGQYVGPWVNVPENMKLTVLGFVHCHTQQTKATATNNRRMAPQQQTQKDTRTVSKDFFAWFTFTLATARRIELQKGCKLRIYNAIILPCRSPVELVTPPISLVSLENGNGLSGTVRCEKTVICTNLCERIDALN